MHSGARLAYGGPAFAEQAYGTVGQAVATLYEHAEGDREHTQWRERVPINNRGVGATARGPCSARC
jgi:hypothetical protein